MDTERHMDTPAERTAAERRDQATFLLGGALEYLGSPRLGPDRHRLAAERARTAAKILESIDSEDGP